MTCRCIPGPLGDPCHRCGRPVEVSHATVEDRSEEGLTALAAAIDAVRDGVEPNQASSAATGSLRTGDLRIQRQAVKEAA